MTKGTRGPEGPATVMVTKGTRGPAMTKGPGDRRRGPVWTSVDQCGPAWTIVIIGPVWTSVDQCGMTEMNARTLMFNLGPIDSTTLVKIARYADRKQLTYKITKKGTLLLDGRGKKIHLRKGVVTLRNALDLHALPERVVSRYRIDDFRNDNIVLTTEPNLTKQTNMLHVRKMALVDPQLLKSLHENTTPQPPVDKILRDLDAEMASILKSDADVSEKVPLYNQLLLRYNEMTKMHAAIPTPVVVVKSNTVDNEPAVQVTLFGHSGRVSSLSSDVAIGVLLYCVLSTPRRCREYRKNEGNDLLYLQYCVPCQDSEFSNTDGGTS